MPSALNLKAACASLSILLAYGLGSLPFALLVARWWGTPDLQARGQRQPRRRQRRCASSGLTAGVLVALLDIGKGAAACSWPSG